jgi:hypothetical protein
MSNQRRGSAVRTTHAQRLTKRLNVILLILNMALALLYIWGSSFSWAIPEEKGLVPITGEPLVWATAILPVLAVALLVNVPWGLTILLRKQWSSGRLWLAAVVIWFIAIAIDFAHH